MNLFSEIEGTRGERMATELLRYLILDSVELRSDFVKLLSDRSPVGPLVSFSHFSCYTEHRTDDERSGERGFVDLVIEMDDAVVGIEVKLFAVFQENQPKKYEPAMSKLAMHLGKARDREVKPVIGVLYPEARKQEVKERIGNLSSVLLLPWEELLKSFESIRDSVEQSTRPFLTHSIAFVRESIGFMPDFAGLVPHLRNRFEPGGTPYQREMVAALRRFFPNPGPRLSQSKTYVGYYFFSDNKQEHSGWYGFIPREELRGADLNEAELIIIATVKVHGLSDSFRDDVEAYNTGAWLSKGQEDCRVVNFDQTWDTSAKWAAELEPVVKAFIE